MGYEGGAGRGGVAAFAGRFVGGSEDEVGRDGVVVVVVVVIFAVGWEAG